MCAVPRTRYARSYLMKNADLTRSVMDRVVRFEKRRTRRWMTMFFVVLAVLAVFLGVSFIRAYSVVSERRTLDVLEIFREDREVVSEYWQDTISVALMELPIWTIVCGIGLSVLLGAVWVKTRRARQITRRRIAALAKRRESMNNRT